MACAPAARRNRSRNEPCWKEQRYFRWAETREGDGSERVAEMRTPECRQGRQPTRLPSDSEPGSYLMNEIASGYFQTSPLFALIAATIGKMIATTPSAIRRGMPMITKARMKQTTA